MHVICQDEYKLQGQGRSQEFATGWTKEGVWEQNRSLIDTLAAIELNSWINSKWQKSPSGVQGQSPSWVWERSPEAGDKC